MLNTYIFLSKSLKIIKNAAKFCKIVQNIENMRKYFSVIFNSMNAEKGFKYKGVDKEVATHFVIEKEIENLPVIIECFGITFEDKNYEIYRENQNRYVIEYVVSGEGTVEINDKVFNVKGGDVYILEANTVQHYYSNKSNPFKKYWVNFKSDLFGNLLSLLNLNGIYHFPNVHIEELFQSLFSLEQMSSFSGDISFSAMNIIFQILLTIKENLTKTDSNVPEIIKQAKLLIDESLQTSLNVNEICDKLYISKSSLITNFKKYYGITPNAYKSQKKIQVARMYLKNSNMSINSISQYLGFGDTYTFSHWFKKEKGLSPLAYRKKYRNLNKNKEEIKDEQNNSN